MILLQKVKQIFYLKVWVKMFRSISNYRNWDLASTPGFPLLHWQNKQWPGSLWGQQAGLCFSVLPKWQPVCGLQTILGHVCPWRNAIYLHMEFITILMVLRSSQVKWKQRKFRKPAWGRVHTNRVATLACNSLKQKNAPSEVASTAFWVSIACRNE